MKKTVIVLIFIILGIHVYSQDTMYHKLYIKGKLVVRDSARVNGDFLLKGNFSYPNIQTTTTKTYGLVMDGNTVKKQLLTGIDTSLIPFLATQNIFTKYNKFESNVQNVDTTFIGAVSDGHYIYSNINYMGIYGDIHLINDYLSDANYTSRFGTDAGKINSGANNLFLGYRAGYNNSTGESNTFMGSTCGDANTAGIRNVFIGIESGHRNVTGSFNTCIGSYSMNYNTTGFYNTTIGEEAGYQIGSNGEGTSSNNTFLGYNAGRGAGSVVHFKSFSTALGSNALANDTANSNTAIGYQAGYYNISGTPNIYIGYQAGYNNTTGSSNTFIGYQAGFTNVSGTLNTYIGQQAGYLSTGSGAISIGILAGSKSTATETYANVFIGNSAGQNNTSGLANVFIGHEAGLNNISGARQTFIGWNAGKNTTGEDNTLIGSQSGAFNTTGAYNVFIGSNAGYNNTTGTPNTFIGYQSGYSNVSGGGNVFIGYQSGYGNSGSDSLEIANNKTNNLIEGSFSSGIVTINSILKLTPQASPPGSPVEGQIYSDTDHHLYFYDGSTWKQLDN